MIENCRRRRRRCAHILYSDGHQQLAGMQWEFMYVSMAAAVIMPSNQKEEISMNGFSLQLPSNRSLLASEHRHAEDHSQNVQASNTQFKRKYYFKL